MPIKKDYEIVIVGAGIAGLALANVMSSKGYSVLILEKQKTYREMLRGDWVAPWGVKELMKLELFDVVSGLGVLISKHMQHDEIFRSSSVEIKPTDLGGLIPGVKGALGIEYEKMREALYVAASDKSCEILKGVDVLGIDDFNASKSISFLFNKVRHRVKSKVIVGADGRASMVRMKIKKHLQQAPVHHFYFGLLIKDVPEWPSGSQLSCTEGDFSIVCNPVSQDKIRTYINVDLVKFPQFREQGFLECYLKALNMESVPNIDKVLSGLPASECLCMPNYPTWVDDPVAPGVVLIGDSAGTDDPITGQGISVALRDVRLVSEILINSIDWTEENIFQSYVDERKERMRKLRFTSFVIATRDAEFDSEAKHRRRKFYNAIKSNPEIGMPLWSQYIGPDKLPVKLYDKDSWERIFSGMACYPEQYLDFKLIH